MAPELPGSNPDVPDDPEPDAEVDLEHAEATPDTDSPPAPARRGALAGRLAVALGGLLAGAAVVLTVLMFVEHRDAAAQRSHEAAMVDGARASITALLSIDHTRAKADVQRVLDLSTGTFREDFAKTADDFVKTAEDKDVITTANIKAAALESSGAETGVVLLAVDSEVTNSNGAREDPRPFRMSVTVNRDGEVFKMSNLEFVP